MSHSVTRHTVGGPAEPGEPGLPASGGALHGGTTAAVRRRRPSPTARRQRRAAFLFLAPACVMVAIYVVWPILSTIRLSFFNWDGMTEPSFVGLANYVELFHAQTFYTALKNNLIWLLLFLLAPPMGLAVALYLNQAVAGIRIVKSLFFAPFVLSGVVVGLIFSWFYDPTFGLLAVILGHGVPVLGDPRYATLGIVFAALWPQTAYCMILYLTGLTSLNAEQIEAARMEGARGWSMLWHVILPQCDDRRRTVREFDRACLLHVRPGDQVLPHRLFRGGSGRAVLHHAGVHRLSLAADAASRAIRSRPCFRSRSTNGSRYRAGCTN